jgi:hypothetical protein
MPKRPGLPCHNALVDIIS